MWKKSGILKKRKFHIVLLAEILLLLYGLSGMLRGEESLYSFDSLNVTLSGGEALADGSYTVDAADGVYGDWLTASGFSLGAGVYRLVCTYETEGNEISAIGVHAANAPFRALLANDASLYANVGTKSCQFYVTGNLGEDQGLSIVITYLGDVPLTVTGLEIIKTTGGSSILIFFTLLGSFLIDSLMMLYEYTRENRLSREWVMAWCGVPALGLAASIPLMVDYILVGADIPYHLLRIEFLAESLAQGVFPVRIAGMWLYGHGYASSVFYCDTFLLIPAALRLIGFSIIFSYAAYVLVVNLATAAAAYICFGRMFEDKRLGMLGSLLYTLAPYRLYNIYNRSAVGEYTAMIFLPVVALGFYLLLGRADEENRKHSRDWLVLVIGFSGIIQSHVLTCELAVIFSALLCLLCIRRVFRKETFLSLVKAVAATVLLNLWFVGPMLDMMLSGEYRYSLNTESGIQDRGVRLANLLLTNQNAGTSSNFTELGLYDTEPIEIGIALLFGVVVYFLLRRNMKKADPHYDHVGLAACLIGLTAAFLSTCYFPWDSLGEISSVLGMLGSMLQFPTRLTEISTVCMVMAACVAGRWILQNQNSVCRNLYFTVIISLSVLFAMNQLNDVLFSSDGTLWLYTEEALGSTNILGAEYLPADVEQDFLYHDATVPDDGQVTILEYSRENLETYTWLKVGEEAEEAWVELPMLYYKGYRAQDADTGEELTVVSGTNGHVRVLLTSGYIGVVHAWYAGMWYWKVFELISLLTAAGLCIGYVRAQMKTTK